MVSFNNGSARLLKDNLVILPGWEALIEDCVQECKDDLEIKPPLGSMYGRQVRQNRDVAFFSDTSTGYAFSKQVAKSKPLSAKPSMNTLLTKVNARYNASFNGILVNRYVGGDNFISAHSDSLDGVDAHAGVVAISYGQPRIFRLRDKESKQIVFNTTTEHATALIMAGDEFQQILTHEVPKQKKLDGTRYSFTFRCHTK